MLETLELVLQCTQFRVYNACVEWEPAWKKKADEADKVPVTPGAIVGQLKCCREI